MTALTPEECAERFVDALAGGATLVAHPDMLERMRESADGRLVLAAAKEVVPAVWLDLGQLVAMRREAFRFEFPMPTVPPLRVFRSQPIAVLRNDAA